MRKHYFWLLAASLLNLEADGESQRLLKEKIEDAANALLALAHLQVGDQW